MKLTLTVYVFISALMIFHDCQYILTGLDAMKKHLFGKIQAPQDGFAVRLSVDHRPDNAGERRCSLSSVEGF